MRKRGIGKFVATCIGVGARITWLVQDNDSSLESRVLERRSGAIKWLISIE